MIQVKFRDMDEHELIMFTILIDSACEDVYMAIGIQVRGNAIAFHLLTNPLQE